jgi:hypothetical protein
MVLCRIRGILDKKLPAKSNPARKLKPPGAQRLNSLKVRDLMPEASQQITGG